jgi:hypothetical protein
MVDHPLHVVKNLFSHKKIRYRGKAKKRCRTADAVWFGISDAGHVAIDGLS